MDTRFRHVKVLAIAVVFSLPCGLLAAYLEGSFTVMRVIAYTASALPLVWTGALGSAYPDAGKRCLRHLKTFLGSRA